MNKKPVDFIANDTNTVLIKVTMSEKEAPKKPAVTDGATAQAGMNPDQANQRPGDQIIRIILD